MQKNVKKYIYLILSLGIIGLGLFGVNSIKPKATRIEITIPAGAGDMFKYSNDKLVFKTDEVQLDFITSIADGSEVILKPDNNVLTGFIPKEVKSNRVFVMGKKDETFSIGLSTPNTTGEDLKIVIEVQGADIKK